MSILFRKPRDITYPNEDQQGMLGERVGRGSMREERLILRFDYPEEWPPLFGSPLEAYSVRVF
ncbi:hypothetical protein IFM47457_02070 [Aspergillus lentulus]|nr:hypothetical protein IFM47457_02070 [Aspergillus lentulus]